MMKVSVIYHPKSDHARKVEEFAHDFEKREGQRVELISLETRDGAATATLYDIVNYPAVLALRDNGELLNFWQGDILPRMDDVASYLAA